jgi:hypothetical protein
MALALLLGAFALWWVWPRRKPTPRAPDPLAAARALLGVPAGATADAVETAFRQRLRTAHPDAGGSSDATRRLTEARDLLLASQTRDRH